MGKVFHGDIEDLMEDIIQKSIKELRKQNLLSNGRMTPYQKMEKVLFDYNSYKEAIKDKYERIDELKQVGIHKKSRSVVTMPSGSSITTTDEERTLEAIDSIKRSIVLTERFIAIIENALDKIKDEPYADVVKRYYIDKEKIMDIAIDYDVDESTIRRNKSQLINKLSIFIFSDDCIMELLDN